MLSPASNWPNCGSLAGPPCNVLVISTVNRLRSQNGCWFRWKQRYMWAVYYVFSHNNEVTILFCTYVTFRVSYFVTCFSVEAQNCTCIFDKKSYRHIPKRIRSITGSIITGRQLIPSPLKWKSDILPPVYCHFWLTLTWWCPDWRRRTPRCSEIMTGWPSPSSPQVMTVKYIRNTCKIVFLRNFRIILPRTFSTEDRSPSPLWYA